MELQFNGHKLTAISIVLPKKCKSFYDSMYEFEKNSSKIKIAQENMGINQHYICDKNIYASHLGTKALEQLLTNKQITKNEIDMLIVATSTPDYLIPSVSSLIHKNLFLNEKTLCKDVVYFCSGFSQVLLDAFLYLENNHFNKIVIISILTKSKKTYPGEKLARISKSDSACAVIIEKSNIKQECFYTQQIFSKHVLDESHPIAAYRPTYKQTSKYNNNFLFNTIQNKLPVIISNFFKRFNIDKDNIDCFFLHQPNLFFHKKMIENLELNANKIFLYRLPLYGDAGINNNIIELFLYKKYNNIKSTKKIFMISYGAGITVNCILFSLDFDKLNIIDIAYI
ncbi:3-oxoacyl-[acyl-carrier-protein] synthase III C-terminal domain-containing protein [Campylobacter lari]|uniref:3-oxoacyl-[acyl-carrier-protein] synthase III C-terminal domain-containing protein n=2 Tax=Campylobacteraceae TaxID=72294 RepID=UPI000B3FD379|nr:3-oxoacyl-[acyl-carrier-protein] synthase III C-terminal domain-containing protein [Campylobacter lari]MCR6528525.1 hypothetical protein [Campylobacter lari]